MYERIDRLEILLLCDFNQNTAGTIVDHIDAFRKYSKHKFHILSNRGDLPLALDLQRFDALVVHYSHVISYDSFISKNARLAIRSFQGFKAVFVQDDYRWINRTVAALRYLKVDAVFCLAPPSVATEVYSASKLPGVKTITTMAGYVPKALTQIEPKPYESRSIDVAYRARKLSAWIGSHAQEKWLIADKFLSDASLYDLKTDISYREEDRIYGNAWIEFIRDCRATLGSESGSSVCDFTGEIQRNVEAHEKEDPSATFEELRRLYFKDVDRKLMMNIISPRCFEAASLRTLMILYEGDYSGVLQPWRHYVPLRKDHSNMQEVIEILRDKKRWREIVENAYSEVALNPKYSFRAMVQATDLVISQGRKSLREVSGYLDSEFKKVTEVSSLSSRQLNGVRWKWVRERARKFFTHDLVLLLVGLFAWLKSERIRKGLKKTYFGVLNAVARGVEFFDIGLDYVRIAKSLGVGKVIEVFTNPDFSLRERAILARELLQLTEILGATQDARKLFLEGEIDFSRRLLTIRGLVPDPVIRTSLGKEESDTFLRLIADPGLEAIEWKFSDLWALSPTLSIPDRIQFVQLQKAIRNDPSILTVFLQESACSIRIASEVGAI